MRHDINHASRAQLHMVTPSQGEIECKSCGKRAVAHKAHRLFCIACGKRKQVEYQRVYRERLKATPRLVTCKGCGREFSTERSGRMWRCQPCTTAYQAELSRRDHERHAGYSRNYRAKLGSDYRERMTRRRADAIAAMTPDELSVFRRKEADKSARLNALLRQDVLAAYGGPRCACCGESEPLFLSIDHVDNDGAEMRRSGVHSRGGTQFYQWLRKSGFPTGFQVLCMNCNLGKHRNQGVCPHQSRKV